VAARFRAVSTAGAFFEMAVPLGAAANPSARLENYRIYIAFVKPPRGSESRGARADNDDIGLETCQSWLYTFKT